MSSDLLTLSAVELLRLYRSKRASPVEVTRAVLKRIDELNPLLNCFCYLAPDALAMARESEARWMKGAPKGALDGVPASIKDLLLTRGWPTLRGSKTVDSKGPWNDDAPAVARLREAGALLIGKTTTPEFGWKGVTDNPLTGITRNPWNPARTPGGSSGGAAAGLAAGMGPLALGTDGGGSIRIPCAFTGVFGLKPSFGRVPAWPLSPFGTVAHVGPMTRSVHDAALLLNVLAQPDARDWHALPREQRDYRVGLDEGVRGLRIAYSARLGYAQVDAEVEALVEQAAMRFVDLGALVEPVDPGFANAEAVFRTHWFSGAALLLKNFSPQQKALMDQGLVEVADQGARIGMLEVLEAAQKRGALGVHMNQFHEKYDLLLTPALPLAAFQAGKEVADVVKEKRWTDWTPFSYPFNLTQQPAASVPCGLTAEGLPVGLQIVGPRYADALVLRAARAFESAQPFRMPDVSGLSTS
ncbi:MAG TPA: amidase [Burkholderiales bacterium]|nr:amidase [Burkholderiales bacterium]